MGRPKKELSLIERVLKGEEIDYSDYTHKELIECIEALVAKVNEKKGATITETQLKLIKNALENQAKKIGDAITKTTAPTAPTAKTEQAAPTTPTEPTAPNAPTKPQA